MELARDRNESQTRHSNRRCAGIAGARRENSGAITRNGRVPSCTVRDAGVFRTTADHGARLADTVCCLAIQQARAKRGGWRLVPYDMLKVGLALLCEPFFFDPTRRAPTLRDPPYRSRVRFDGRARHSLP